MGGGRRPMASYGKIKKAMQDFLEQGVEMCFCLGDLVDNAPKDTKEAVRENLHSLMELIRSYNIPFYTVVGNHDYLKLTAEDWVKEGIEIPPYTVIKDNYKFIILDANYLSNMERFDIGGVVWDDSNLPREQVELLERELDCDMDCVVMVHENLDPTVDKSHIIKNAEEIRRIIGKSRNVRAVIQGHYHNGSTVVIDNIPYITLKAMCEHDSDVHIILDI
ncbi:MAG: metallophosphoesterase [Clostridia bacterium]|nr:metallophosphoesterase [Clostridia bacterium]